MRIQVDYPGYWAHGRTYNAKRAVLQIRSGDNLQGKVRKKQWRSKPTGDPDIFEVECFLVVDPKNGEFAIPLTRARVVETA